MHSQSHHHHQYGRVKEEEEHYMFGETSSYPTNIAFAFASSPQPLVGLEGVGPPPFLTKTYEIVDDPATNHVVSWNSGGNGFVVWDAHAFSAALLPKYFKHNNFSSFIRQLNTYGFRKVDQDRWEFANECFLRGQKHLLKNIRRRKTPQSSSQVSSILSNQQCLDPCVEVGSFGTDGEIDRLKRDKQVLMSELVKLRQQQQNLRSYLEDMEQRLKKTESKQRQMMSFLARAVRSPGLLRQLVERSDKRKGIKDSLEKKRRRTIDRVPSNVDCCEVSDIEVAEEVKMFDAGDGRMNGFVEDLMYKIEQQEEHQQQQQQQQEGGIWEEMGLGYDVVAFEDVNVLIDGLEDYNNVADLDHIFGGTK